MTRKQKQTLAMTATGESVMRSTLFSTACAILALAVATPVFAQTYTTPEQELAPGYYVAPDGAIEYRDPTAVDAVADDVYAPPPSADIYQNLPMVEMEPVFGSSTASTTGGEATVFEAPPAAVATEIAPIFDAAPIETITTGVAVSEPVMATEIYEVLETAPAAIADTGMSYDAVQPVGSETFSVTSGQTIDIDATDGPQTITIEVAPPEYIVTEEVIDGGALPIATASVDPSYVSSSLPAMASHSGVGYSSISGGDGQYGPSIIERGGEGLASRNVDLFISKSAIIKLPVGASEVIIADPGVVRAELRTNRQTILYGTRVGSTNAFFLDENGNQILNLEINIRYDLRPLRAALARTFPDTPVEIDTVLGEVIVSATVGDVTAASDISSFVRRYLTSAIRGAGGDANFEDVQVVERFNVDSDDQVLLKVRVAEMKRNVIKQFGVNWSVTDGPSALGLANPSTLGNLGNVTNGFPVNGAILGGIAANLTGSIGAFSFGSLIRAFEQHNVIRVLAEPTLTAVSGETASFLAGGEFPYPVSVQDGEIGFEFRDFGVALEFTPVVIGDGRISLRINTEVSELTNEGAITSGNISIPGLAVRRASTTVELASGGTMSIAGLLQQRDAATSSGLPGIKSLPVLGQLFSSSDYSSSETELVVLVTPYVVGQAREQDFRLPTDGFAAASDMDFFLLGQIHKVYGAGERDEAAARKVLEAPIGFILE